MARNGCLVVLIAAVLATAALPATQAQILGLVNSGVDRNANGYDDNYRLSRFGNESADGSTLNGNTLGLSALSHGQQSLSNWRAFSASRGFVEGPNQLVFAGRNAPRAATGNPTDVCAEFLESSDIPVPEPHGWAVILAGLGMVGTITWRRQNVR